MATRDSHGCGATFEWTALPLIGFMAGGDDGTVPMEGRNCTCGSTLWEAVDRSVVERWLGEVTLPVRSVSELDAATLKIAWSANSTLREIAECERDKARVHRKQWRTHAWRFFDLVKAMDDADPGPALRKAVQRAKAEADAYLEANPWPHDETRPDFRGFAAHLRTEAAGSSTIHREDGASDARSLEELAKLVERTGRRLGYFE